MVSALTCIAKWFRGVAGMAALGMGVTGLLGASSISARAQEPTTVERTAKGATAKSIEVGLYLNVKPDCTTGTLPAIRLVEAPANGTVIIKQAKVRATNYKQCLAGSARFYCVLSIQAGFFRRRQGGHRGQIPGRPHRTAAHHRQCRHRTRRAEDLARESLHKHRHRDGERYGPICLFCKSEIFENRKFFGKARSVASAVPGTAKLKYRKQPHAK
jgi:hypothetical protein